MRVLAVATDAGGAANVAPVAALIPPSSRRTYCSGATEPIFRDCGVTDAAPWPEGQDADAVLARCAPDVVLCGTTSYASADRELVRAARSAGVPVVVVLDEWYRYAQRFLDAPEEPLVVPDRICVQDALARDEAVADGLPATCLVMTGSPALSALADRIERFAVSPPEAPAFLLDQPRPWIVFVSEAHAVACGSEPDARGPWGPFLGFTEHTVGADLAAVLAAMARPCTVVEKLHPSAPDTTMAAPALATDQVWLRVGRVPLDALFWHANLIVGMRSAALLEAAMAGCPVTSFQPGLSPGYGPATCERFGLVTSTGSPGQLRAWLEENWAGARRTPIRPPFASSGAARRVCDVVGSVTRRGTPA